jgi:hypothetical protein
VRRKNIGVRFAVVDSDDVASVGPVQDLGSGSGSKSPQKAFWGFCLELGVIHAVYFFFKWIPVPYLSGSSIPYTPSQKALT